MNGKAAELVISEAVCFFYPHRNTMSRKGQYIYSRTIHYIYKFQNKKSLWKSGGFFHIDCKSRYIC